MLLNFNSNRSQSIEIKISPFRLSIANIDNVTARRKELAKVIDNFLYQNILAPWRKSDFLTIRQNHWNALSIPFPRITLL